ncbi:helix-turn-helix domain-containing protein [Candidatus Bathyarchaeota archaeon]|nr:helix-turn-helix domain-containing protein [Candidatus Bathyarchaeota archaeon]
MPSPKYVGIHKAGMKVLKAISSPIRLQILDMVLDRGSMSYTEIMSSLKLDSSRDAGRFAYHLKSLINADLIEPEIETKRYSLTVLGRRIIEITDEIEDRTYKRWKMLVRTSNLTMEEFDRNRIAQSLVTEAGVPTDLALRIARETEKRLQRFKTKYLTAPLIREIVNAILLEKHYEDYRHKLTRLGLPVHEVTRLLNSQQPNASAIRKAAADSVMEEYTLLNVLPRRIADAHLSGSIHLDNLGTWVLKPHEMTHDISHLLEKQNPRTLESALNTILKSVRRISTETTGYQNLDDFNLHLAAYSRNLKSKRIEHLLRLFIRGLNLTSAIPTTISLSFSNEKESSFEGDSLSFASLLLRALIAENIEHPLLNPRIVVKLESKTAQDESFNNIIHEAHRLASTSILVNFANLQFENQKHASYSASGLRLTDDWHKESDLDTHRTGNLDVITINLPRISFEARSDEDKFLDLLEDQLDIAIEALDVKYRAIEKRIQQNLLPYLACEVDEDSFKLENTTRVINLLGLTNAVNALILPHKEVNMGRTYILIEKILKHVNKHISRFRKKPDCRLVPAIVPNRVAKRRVYELDLEKYGLSMVKTSYFQAAPSYSDVDEISPFQEERLDIEERIHQLSHGGHMSCILHELAPLTPEGLAPITEKLTIRNIGFFNYQLFFTICHRCRSSTIGTHARCPHCGSTRLSPLTNTSEMADPAYERFLAF